MSLHSSCCYGNQLSPCFVIVEYIVIPSLYPNNQCTTTNLLCSSYGCVTPEEGKTHTLPFLTSRRRREVKGEGGEREVKVREVKVKGEGGEGGGR